MTNEQKELLRTIEIMIKHNNNKLKFNRYIEGYVVANNENGTYEVMINNEKHRLKAREGLTVNIGEVYWICVVNNDFSKKYIIEKRLI